MSRLVSLMHQLCSMHVFRYEKNQKIYTATDWRTNKILGGVRYRKLDVQMMQSNQSSLSVRLIGSISWCEEWCQSPSARPPAALLTSHRGVDSLTLPPCVCVCVWGGLHKHSSCSEVCASLAAGLGGVSSWAPLCTFTHHTLKWTSWLRWKLNWTKERKRQRGRERPWVEWLQVCGSNSSWEGKV